MDINNEFGNITFDLPKNQSNVIKVIGVGGGGSNAINHMFRQGIAGVDFVVCNTDAQALYSSPVPNKIQLGLNLTEGLGAGAKPEVGHQAALESIEEIEKMLDANTKMVFITAGMGGGTGTGAAPVIAQLAKERGILTVGIVTIPFQFEGKNRSEQALAGVERLRKHVDSLIVINNNKLREVYGNLGFKAGFAKADEVLSTASKGIAEVITNHLTMNIDLKDAKTVLSDSGTAIMGSAVATGEYRAKEAIVSALDSPLLNDSKIAGAKNVLLLITFGSHEITIDEISEINEYIQDEAGHNANIIMGIGEDEKLEEAVSVTVIATGFNAEQQRGIINAEPEKIIHALDSEQKVVHDLSLDNIIPTVNINPVQPAVTSQNVVETTEKVVFQLEEEKLVVNEIIAQAPIQNVEETIYEVPVLKVESLIDAAFVQPESDLIATTDYIKNLDVFFEIVTPQPKAEQPVVNTFVNPSFEASKHEFEIISSKVNDIVVNEAEVIVPVKEYGYTTDLFSAKVEEPVQNTITFELTEEIVNVNEVEVNAPQHFTPVAEVNKDGMIRYTLDEIEEIIPVAKVEEKVVEKIDENLNFTFKKQESPVVTSVTFNEVSPVEMSIEEILKARTDERKRKLKDFNHKFNNSNKIDELEKVPAYKRVGMDVTSMPNPNNQSRTSLGIDSNDDLQLRSNNSFLHDNVD